MSLDFSALVVLHGRARSCTRILCALVLVRPPLSRTAAWLAIACLVTACGRWRWSSSTAIPSPALPGWLELARAGAWYAFILHLYRRSVAARGQLMQAFSTMGLLGFLMVGGLVLTNLLESQTPGTLWLMGIGVRLGIAVCNMLLLENLYFNTRSRCPLARQSALRGAGRHVFIRSGALLRRRAVPRRSPGRCSKAGRPSTMIAAPLIAMAAVRDRRWKVDIHVSRDVVFHSLTLVISGLFLMGLALTGEVFRRGGAEWGHVVEVSLICAGVLTIAVVLTSGSHAVARARRAGR